MQSSHAKSSPLPFTPAVPEPVEVAKTPAPFWPRLGRALGLIAVAASLHIWVVAPPNRQAASRLSAGSPVMLRTLSVAPLPGASPLLTGRVLPAASDRSVVVRSTLVTVKATPAPTDSSLESHPAPRLVPVGTTGHTIIASRTPKTTPPPTALPPARSLAELKRDEDGSGGSPTTTAVAAAAAARTMPVTDTAPPPAIAARVVPPTAADELNKQKEIVLAVLREYSRAYERLDVRATKAVYPSVDDRKLQRAFQELEGQQVRFASCGVSISSSGAGANARCRGDATYRPKVGSRIMRLTDVEWTFSLSRDGSSWQILDARMQ